MHAVNVTEVLTSRCQEADWYQAEEGCSGVKKLVIAILVLGGLLVAADFAAAAATEYQVSKKMRAELGLTEDPAVRINGFPFIVQALNDDFRDIRIQATGVPIGERFRDAEVGLDLHHVQADFMKLAQGQSTPVTVADAKGEVKVHAAEIGKLVGIADLKVQPVGRDQLLPPTTPKPAPTTTTGPPPVEDPTTAAVKLTGTVAMGADKSEISVYALLQLNGTQIVVTPKRLDLEGTFGNIKIPEALQPLLLKAFATTVDLGTLPFNATPTRVFALQGILGLEGTATNIQLGAKQPGAGQ
ncbi:DUF2993 domain-containing protein [Pseudonocardiaceae bacterium YIM PH 21723]|nr:DUF2993 domain-containing protein [Pseudonocardiaceae bacterium YIM PH 21723]